jgi:rsbT co-antagonist protein RsbR
VEANDQAVRTYGYTREEMMQLDAGAWMPPEERHTLPKRLLALREGAGVVYESVHLKKDGSRFPVEISARVIPADSGPLLLAIGRDISHRKDQEQQIDRLTRLYAALSQINKAIVHSKTRGDRVRFFEPVLESVRGVV